MHRFLVVVLFFILSAAASQANERVLVQSTTSTQNSGFYDYILPIIETETGLDVDIVAVGTGQAIRNAMNGDADLLLVHSKADELAFVADGWGIARFDLMYNDFVLIGPADDPDALAGLPLSEAMVRLAVGNTPFVSRGDESGTHKAEAALWAAAGLAPRQAAANYIESGAGMGATIRMAVELGGYTLSDRATWIAYGNKGSHRVLVEDDPALFNQYGVIAVNPKRHGHVNAKGAEVLVDWLLSPHGQAVIAGFRVNGAQLFFPNAARR